jgi:hypothetical protein
MSIHAKEQTLARVIEYTDIERVINNPVETICDPDTGRYKSFGPYSFKGKSCYLKIIHTTLNKDVVTIITIDLLRN